MGLNNGDTIFFRCTENTILYWFGEIKTCYLEVSCPTNTLRYTHYGAVVRSVFII